MENETEMGSNGGIGQLRRLQTLLLGKALPEHRLRTPTSATCVPIVRRRRIYGRLRKIELANEQQAKSHQCTRDTPR